MSNNKIKWKRSAYGYCESKDEQWRIDLTDFPLGKFNQDEKFTLFRNGDEVGKTRYQADAKDLAQDICDRETNLPTSERAAPKKSIAILPFGEESTIIRIDEYPGKSREIELSNEEFSLLEEKILRNLAENNPALLSIINQQLSMNNE